MLTFSGDYSPSQNHSRDVKEEAIFKAQYQGLGADQWEDFAEEIQQAHNLEEFEERLKKQGWDHDTTYPYTNEDGQEIYEARRYIFRLVPQKKKFIIRHKTQDGYAFGKAPVSVPYNLPRLVARKGEPIVFCEGEKDADRAMSEGLRATTIQAAAGWSSLTASYFEDEEVIVVPDNDESGAKRAEEAIRWLTRVGARVRVVDLDGLKRTGDLSDWFDGGGTAEQLLEIARRVHPEPGLARLKAIDPGVWEGQEVPRREWLVKDVIPADAVGSIYGDGGLGKSTVALQLAVARAIGAKWLDLETKLGRTLYFSCEDKAAELHKRLDAIRQHYSVSFAAMEGVIRLYDLTEDDALMATVGRDGTVTANDLFRTVRREAQRHEADLIVIDSLANVFGGNENDRSQVRQFVSLLNRLAVDGRSVVILAHPSLTGLISGRGTSGSTAWNNSVRWRVNFQKGDDPEAQMRELSVQKSNYGPADVKLRLQWQEGAYAVVGGPINKVVAQERARSVFLTLLRRLTRDGRRVSHNSGSTYAPAVFEGEREAKEAFLKKAALKEAMAALFENGMIKAEEDGPPSKRRSYIVETGDERPF
jgi:RecA-family ATPase